MSFKLDRIRFSWRGIWNQNIFYKKDDIIYYEGKAYSCLKAHTSSSNFYDNYDPTFKDEEVTVTVGEDTAGNQEQGHFYLNGVEVDDFILLKNRTYIFNQNDNSNISFNDSSNPFIISSIQDGIFNGGNPWLAGIFYYLNDSEVSYDEYVSNFSQSSSRYLKFVVDETSPIKLYYYSPNNSLLGNNLQLPYNSYWIKMFDGVIWKNNWESQVFYPTGAMIRYNSNIYISKKYHQSTEFSNDITQDLWDVVVNSVRYRGNWNIQTNYFLGDIVRYSSVVYICTVEHLSASSFENGLEINIVNWDILIPNSFWYQDWVPNTRYHKNDIVRYGGNIYVSNTAITSSLTEELGLENDVGWEILISGIDYKGDWQSFYRYKLGDIVKVNGSLWKCIYGHTSDTDFLSDVLNFVIYVPGLQFENVWDSTVNYYVGDIVIYGGYTYACILENISQNPNEIENSVFWELITTNYKINGDWQPDITYKPGDVLRYSGYLYIATHNTYNEKPSENLNKWQLLIKGRQFRSEWNDNLEYFVGDIVLWKGFAYICITEHLSSSSGSRPDLDIEYTSENFWELLIQGTATNVMAFEGDIILYDDSKTALQIGNLGTQLRSVNGIPSWIPYETVENIFYVSMEGSDVPTAGKSISSPFRSVKYACQHIFNNIDSNQNSTIFIKTGIYEEILPISVPKNCALVGDELRSVTIQPAAGYEQLDMFYLRNGSGIRNLTLQGLYGTLTQLDQFLTRRTTAGAFVSLDPGAGPDDSNTWITSRSPYVQNVTTFGTGCIGMKVDGNLHNGGFSSIVANDFTQILSDGIGYWADNLGRSELVSVFTYYCHIGYLCTNGGILRSTNGNNSYGTYGSVAEGYDVTESPVTARIDNKSLEAQFFEGITYGTNEQKILAIGYSHAGEQYTQANIEFGGSGYGAQGYFTEFRNNAISNIRLLSPDETTNSGGSGYTSVINFAQFGDDKSITISNADDGNSQLYVGQRISIISGTGIGQYAEITDYDFDLKKITVSRESDGENGWDHYQPGYPIEPELNDTTRYQVEPRVVVSDSSFDATSISPPNGFNWTYVASNKVNLHVALTNGQTSIVNSAYSTNGVNWTLTSNITSNIVSDLKFSGSKFIASILQSSTGNPTNVVLISTNGYVWNQKTLPITDNWNSIAVDGNGKIWIVSSTGNICYSSDHGDNWILQTIATTGENWSLIGYGNGILVTIDTSSNSKVSYSNDLGTSWITKDTQLSIYDWNDIEYGNGRFVIISSNTSALSFDGIDWYEGNIKFGNYKYVSYGQGIFLATGDTQLVAKSRDGKIWRTYGDDSSAYLLLQPSFWESSAYTASGWIIVNSSANFWNLLITGAQPIIRASISNSRINTFVIYDPGSNYTTTPVVSVIDNSNTVDALYNVNIRSGVLSQPEMSNRGNGYVTLTGTITGNGFANQYQIGTKIYVKNLTKIPGPGASIEIAGIQNKRFSLSEVTNISGINGALSALITISPSIDNIESPGDNSLITIRERYSQIRITGHDFLDIGTGNFSGTRYPTLYLEGEDAENARQPFNETYAVNSGRIFFTSTDQDGNFRVGDLFAVDQATGIVTINASQFDFTGLTELSLGGIQIGASNVVIREFSKDGNFTANSNFVVPTQKAIRTYIASRVSGGESNATTNVLKAGQIQIQNNVISTTSNEKINALVPFEIRGGIDGHYLASQFFN